MVRALALRNTFRQQPWASCSHTCASSSKFGTGQGAVMPCDWKGNRRSGVALDTRHIDCSGLSTYSVRANAYGREMRTPPTLPMGYGTLYLYLVIIVKKLNSLKHLVRTTVAE